MNNIYLYGFKVVFIRFYLFGMSVLNYLLIVMKNNIKVIFFMLKLKILLVWEMWKVKYF